jgi:outer membrane receptor protein involved in Fe transport
MVVGRIGQLDQGTARTGNPHPGQPFGEWRYFNVDAFAQDSWKLRSNLTLEYGVRFGYWTNNKEYLFNLGGYFDPALYDPTKGRSSIRSFWSCAMSRPGARRPGSWITALRSLSHA